MPETHFIGSKVRARHILVKAEGGEAVLGNIKWQIERRVADGMAKLHPEATALEREKARARLLEDAFSEAARQNSICPSGPQGGDLGWFSRSGLVEESIANAAFALKPLEISEVVKTSHGFHLIVVLERRAAKDVPTISLGR